MKQKITKLMAIIFILGLVSCTKNIKDFNPNSVGNDKGIIFGRITVIYNGEQYNENCGIFMSSPYELDETGLVALPAKQGEITFPIVYCKDTMTTYKYKIEGASFQNAGDGKATYFGDITIDWTTDGGFNPKTCLICLGPIGTVIRDTSYDGFIKMRVSNNLGGTVAEYRNATGESRGNVQTSLMSTGR